MKRSNVATRACTLAVAMVVTCAGLAVAGQNPAPRPADPAQQPPPAGAQMPNMPGMPAAVPMGIVTGVVTKASGGTVAGATVSVTNTTNGVTYSASTDDTGRYALPSLPVASYDVVVTLGGFKVFRRPGVAVAANSTQTVDAETTPLRDPSAYQYDFDLPDIAEVWRRGSVIASWLLDLTSAALAANPELDHFAGRHRGPRWPPLRPKLPGRWDCARR